MHPGEADLRKAIRAALLAQDQPALTRVMVRGLGSVPFGRIRAIATEELAKADHATQVWWSGECNCDGHLN